MIKESYFYGDLVLDSIDKFKPGELIPVNECSKGIINMIPNTLGKIYEWYNNDTKETEYWICVEIADDDMNNVVQRLYPKIKDKTCGLPKLVNKYELERLSEPTPYSNNFTSFNNWKSWHQLPNSLPHTLDNPSIFNSYMVSNGITSTIWATYYRPPHKHHISETRNQYDIERDKFELELAKIKSMNNEIIRNIIHNTDINSRERSQLLKENRIAFLETYKKEKEKYKERIKRKKKREEERKLAMKKIEEAGLTIPYTAEEAVMYLRQQDAMKKAEEKRERREKEEEEREGREKRRKIREKRRAEEKERNIEKLRIAEENKRKKEKTRIDNISYNEQCILKARNNRINNRQIMDKLDDIYKTYKFASCYKSNIGFLEAMSPEKLHNVYEMIIDILVSHKLPHNYKNVDGTEEQRNIHKTRTDRIVLLIIAHTKYKDDRNKDDKENATEAMKSYWIEECVRILRKFRPVADEKFISAVRFESKLKNIAFILNLYDRLYDICEEYGLIYEPMIKPIIKRIIDDRKFVRFMDDIRNEWGLRKYHGHG